MGQKVLLVLFIWNVAPAVSVAGAYAIGGSAAGLTGAAGVLDVSEVLQSFDHDKSQLNKGKLRDLQKLLKYFNGTTTSVSNVLLLADVLPIIFVLYPKDLLVVAMLLFILWLATILLAWNNSHSIHGAMA